jgi:hypothetical protein
MMGTKNNPGKFNCFNVDPDEPTFTLRAKDPSAAMMVRNWAISRFNAIMSGNKPNTAEQFEKIAEALQCASDMEAWHFEHIARPAHEAHMEQTKGRIVETLRGAGVDVEHDLPEVMPGNAKKTQH